MVFTVGALLAGGSPFTTRGRRLRLRIKKFWAETRKREVKSFWAGDRPSSPRILPTGASHWWRTGRPRCHVRPGRAPGGGEMQGKAQQLECGPAAPERSMNARHQWPLNKTSPIKKAKYQPRMSREKFAISQVSACLAR